MRRLRERQAGETERTEGIDIEEWSCRGAKRRLFRAPQEPIQFLAWDFAGQEVYQVTHQCFYSRRAIYLALFRMIDGEEGINELEPWLRNVQVNMYMYMYMYFCSVYMYHLQCILCNISVQIFMHLYCTILVFRYSCICVLLYTYLHVHVHVSTCVLCLYLCGVCLLQYSVSFYLYLLSHFILYFYTQLRAEGCIVIIVGTYLDKVSDSKAHEINDIIKRKFLTKSSSIYPKIISYISVSCVSKFGNNMDKLRQLIYDVSVHLQVSPRDGITRKHNLTLNDTNHNIILIVHV